MGTLREVKCGQQVQVTKLSGQRRCKASDYGYGYHKGDADFCT